MKELATLMSLLFVVATSLAVFAAARATPPQQSLGTNAAIAAPR